jgi:hypothetical protein
MSQNLLTTNWSDPDNLSVGYRLLFVKPRAIYLRHTGEGKDSGEVVPVFSALRLHPDHASGSWRLATISNENLSSSFSFSAPPATETGFNW